MKSKALVIQIAISTVLIATVALWYPKKTTPLPVWPTYTNAVYGFSVQHPPGTIVDAGLPNDLYLAGVIDSPQPIAYISFPRVDTFSENGSHGYYQFQLRFYADEPSIVRQPCSPRLSFLSYEQASSTTMLAGTEAQIFVGGDAAMGNRISYTRYGLCHEGRYYSALDIFASGSDGTPLTPKLESDIAAGRERNKQIIDSLRFVELAKPELE